MRRLVLVPCVALLLAACGDDTVVIGAPVSSSTVVPPVTTDQVVEAVGPAIVSMNEAVDAYDPCIFPSECNADTRDLALAELDTAAALLLEDFEAMQDDLRTMPPELVNLVERTVTDTQELGEGTTEVLGDRCAQASGRRAAACDRLLTDIGFRVQEVGNQVELWEPFL